MLTRNDRTNGAPDGLVKGGVVPLVVHDVQGPVEQGPGGHDVYTVVMYNCIYIGQLSCDLADSRC